MKKFIYSFLCISALISCDTNVQKTAEQAVDMMDGQKPTETLCFLTTGKAIKAEDRTLRDSTILKINVFEKQKVSGKFNWIPAEKDQRKGLFEGAKSGNTIKGAYTYTQEGVPKTATILIKLSGDKATVTTNKDKQDAMTLEVKKVNDCL
ncbi:hypothetical protein SAMN05216480_10135 [Pustulibacterium marinum]|uniref:Uncharacterized protein n=1 Tax=Pustulibacterium marinum TaxID=1224947 RepID=A0A1I7ESW8_9FLAO|nr:hypothetical protein [Pustulibacterium marinum]SFU27006.1 hypothetical protein SAMN05216480_10135 [Pustulibacterium marinum]